MSLFDVIKYPLSTPPTVEELEAIPAELFWKFMHKVRWFSDGIHHNDYKKIETTRAILVMSAGGYPEDLTILKEMIKEYDEPI